MKETPILYTSPMVQGILGDRKKMTRRTKGLENFNESKDWIFEKIKNHKDPKLGCQAYFRRQYTYHLYGAKCPYGQVGDVLWVRETTCPIEQETGGFRYEYKASGYIPTKLLGEKWKPAIHMPKEACRLKLRITNIRVERLQDISEEDAIAEGVKKYGNYYLDYDKNSGISKLAKSKDAIPLHKYAKDSFKSLWQSINGPESWQQNPWVWVVEFERVK